MIHAFMVKVSTFNTGKAHLPKCFRSTERCDKSILRPQKQVYIEFQSKQDFFFKAAQHLLYDCVFCKYLDLQILLYSLNIKNPILLAYQCFAMQFISYQLFKEHNINNYHCNSFIYGWKAD